MDLLLHWYDFSEKEKNFPLKSIKISTAKNIPLGSSGAVIDNICREAALCALYSGLDKITQKDFEQATSRNRV
jgi:ATP-dependent 26S proteasome regulatory subunit